MEATKDAKMEARAIKAKAGLMIDAVNESKMFSPGSAQSLAIKVAKDTHASMTSEPFVEAMQQKILQVECSNGEYREERCSLSACAC